MGSPLVLSLFPGIGLMDRAFEEEGFCVVRGPDLLWGGNIKTFHAGGEVRRCDRRAAVPSVLEASGARAA